MARRKWSIISGIAALGIGLCGTAFAASFTGLGYLPGGERSSSCGALSADGRVVAGWSGYEAFQWTATAGMKGLEDLPGGDFHSRAPAISADGRVVVGWGLSSLGYEAFRWTSAEGMTGLGRLSGADSPSLADAVSADGAVVVGTSQSPNAGYATEAFRWTAAEGVKGLGILPGGRYSEAFATSADGAVVVGTSQSAAGYEAFRWTAADGMQVLGHLPGADAADAAQAVSADGAVVVGKIASPRPGVGPEAFRWTAAEGVKGLGVLPGKDWSSASGISADGSLVVGASGASGSAGEEGNSAAFIWDAAHGMRDLQEMLVDDLGLELNGWTLAEAKAVSRDGLTIAGNGKNPAGQPEAWIVRLDRQPSLATASLPTGFALADNYPNPFNPGTSIRFALPRAAVVRLVIYTLQGQEVATLIDHKRYEAGSYDLTFERASLASGVYLYRLDAGSFHQVKKMTLLK